MEFFNLTHFSVWTLCWMWDECRFRGRDKVLKTRKQVLEVHKNFRVEAELIASTEATSLALGTISTYTRRTCVPTALIIFSVEFKLHKLPCWLRTMFLFSPSPFTCVTNFSIFSFYGPSVWRNFFAVTFLTLSLFRYRLRHSVNIFFPLSVIF